MNTNVVLTIALPWILVQFASDCVLSTNDTVINQDIQNTQISHGSKICTHCGHFHCDEALAVSLLLCLAEYRDAVVVRTRDQAILDTCDVVVDVGGVYDPATMRFDHHQKEFDEYFDEHHKVTRLSSAGLVYKHFGKRIFREVYGIDDEETVEDLYQRVYNNIIEAVDAIDNGVPISDGVLNYRITTDLSSRVGNLNPSWIEDDVDPDLRFKDAMKLTISEFDSLVTNTIRVHLGAKEKFLETYRNRFEVHESGRVIETPRGMPFMSLLYEIERKESVPSNKGVCFYITYDKASEQWRSTCIKEADQQFTSRMPFPQRLCGRTSGLVEICVIIGLRDQELQTASNIPDLTFIHRAGFTCGGKTKESVLKLITLTIQESEESSDAENSDTH